MKFDIEEFKKMSSKEISTIDSLSEADDLIKKISIEKSLILKNALHSDNVNDIFKAQKYLARTNNNFITSQEGGKSMLIDPMQLTSGLGYQDKITKINEAVLRNMGKVPVVKAVVGTRLEQICDFCQVQKDRYSTGFVIRPKKAIRGGDGQIKLSKEQEKKIEFLTEFILNCGLDSDSYKKDSFEDFIKKFAKDSLELDQGSFETVNTLGGDLFSYGAIDGATIRIADTYFSQFDEEYKEKHKSEYVNGYLPFYVQTYMNNVINQYLPWEMAFCVRNPETNIYTSGYGRSELEDLIQVVTNILNADLYNANYFRIGSNPKGILKVTGNVNTSRLEDFKAQWQSQMTGVRNAHRMPIIEADKMDWINTQTSNKDMEYSKYYEFLIKLACAVYKIDPAEINFPLSGGSEQKAMFEGSNEARLKHSKDKGLKPILKFIEAKINKHIIERLDNQYEFVFQGLDVDDQKSEVEDYIKRVQNFMTVDEVRTHFGMKPIGNENGGDEILNPMLMNMKQQQEMMKKASNENSNKYIDDEYGDDEKDENPFIKAMNEEKILDKLLVE